MHLLLRIDEPLSLLSAKAHHLVSALTVGLVAHPLDLWFHPRFPEAAPDQQGVTKATIGV